MTPRLATRIEVSALVRRVQSEGGNAAIIARGDPDAGTILLWLAEKGRFQALYGRTMEIAGQYGWKQVGPEKDQHLQSVNDYITRRQAIDADLWVVELDIADAERFAAQLVAAG